MKRTNIIIVNNDFDSPTLFLSLTDEQISLLNILAENNVLNTEVFWEQAENFSYEKI